MQIDSILLDIEQLTINSNLIKEIVLARLSNDNQIAKEVYDKYKNWDIVIVKKSWLKRLLNPTNDYFYSFVDLNVKE
jgi:hypothetical protein